MAHPPGPAHHLPEGGHIQRRAVELERRPDEDAARGQVHAGAQRGGGDQDAQRPVAVGRLEERPLLGAQAGVVKGDAKPDDHLEGVEVRVTKVTTTATATATAASSSSSSLLAPALLQLAEQVDDLRLGELPAQGGSNRRCGGLAFGGDEGVQLAGDTSGGLLAEPFRRAEDQGGVAAGQCLQGGVNQRRLLLVDVGGKCASRKVVQGEEEGLQVDDAVRHDDDGAVLLVILVLLVFLEVFLALLVSLLRGLRLVHIEAVDNALVQRHRPPAGDVQFGVQPAGQLREVGNGGAHADDLRAREVVAVVVVEVLLLAAAVKEHLGEEQLNEVAAMCLLNHVHLVDDDQADVVQLALLDESV